jgi:hypothetical protein
MMLACALLRIVEVPGSLPESDEREGAVATLPNSSSVNSVRTNERLALCMAAIMLRPSESLFFSKNSLVS